MKKLLLAIIFSQLCAGQAAADYTTTEKMSHSLWGLAALNGQDLERIISDGAGVTKAEFKYKDYEFEFSDNTADCNNAKLPTPFTVTFDTGFVANASSCGRKIDDSESQYNYCDCVNSSVADKLTEVDLKNIEREIEELANSRKQRTVTTYANILNDYFMDTVEIYSNHIGSSYVQLADKRGCNINSLMESKENFDYSKFCSKDQTNQINEIASRYYKKNYGTTATKLFSYDRTKQLYEKGLSIVMDDKANMQNTEDKKHVLKMLSADLVKISKHNAKELKLSKTEQEEITERLGSTLPNIPLLKRFKITTNFDVGNSNINDTLLTSRNDLLYYLGLNEPNKSTPEEVEKKLIRAEAVELENISSRCSELRQSFQKLCSSELNTDYNIDKIKNSPVQLGIALSKALSVARHGLTDDGLKAYVGYFQCRFKKSIFVGNDKAPTSNSKFFSLFAGPNPDNLEDESKIGAHYNDIYFSNEVSRLKLAGEKEVSEVLSDLKKKDSERDNYIKSKSTSKYSHQKNKLGSRLQRVLSRMNFEEPEGQSTSGKVSKIAQAIFNKPTPVEEATSTAAPVAMAQPVAQHVALPTPNSRTRQSSNTSKSKIRSKSDYVDMKISSLMDQIDRYQRIENEVDDTDKDEEIVEDIDTASESATLNNELTELQAEFDKLKEEPKRAKQKVVQKQATPTSRAAQPSFASSNSGTGKVSNTPQQQVSQSGPTQSMSSSSSMTSGAQTGAPSRSIASQGPSSAQSSRGSKVEQVKGNVLSLTSERLKIGGSPVFDETEFDPNDQEYLAELFSSTNGASIFVKEKTPDGQQLVLYSAVKDSEGNIKYVPKKVHKLKKKVAKKENKIQRRKRQKVEDLKKLIKNEASPRSI